MNKGLPIFFFFIFLFSFWIFWLPGPRVANDYHLGSTEIIKDSSLPWIWREAAVSNGLGEYTITTLWSLPIHIFFRILLEFNIPLIWITKILLTLILIFGFFSISKLLSYLKIQDLSKYVGILFYLSNSFFLLLIDGGQLSVALAYVTVPLSIYFYLKTMDEKNFKNRIMLSFSLIAVSFFEIRFIFLLFLIFFIHSLFTLINSKKKDSLKLIKNLVILGSQLGLGLVLIHAYWLLPMFFSRVVQLPQTYERVSQVDFLSLSSLAHSIFLQQPHWYQNIFGKISNPKVEFSLIPILAFLTLFLRRRDKIVGFWLLVAITGIFLSKGSQSPFGFIYMWLFTHVPGFSLFRDPVKFYLFTALSYTILISISVMRISVTDLNKKNIFKLTRYFPHAVFIYLILLMWPVYFNQMTGMFSEPRFENEYSKQAEILSRDPIFSRIFWIPTEAPLGYSNLNHSTVSASSLAQKRPFAVGIKGSYETFNFLREAPFMGEIFDVAGIGYIVDPFLDSRRDEMSPDNIKYYYTFLNQLSKRPWLSRVENSSIPLLKTSEHQDRFFVTPNIWWVIGSDNIYNEATKSSSLKLSKNALIFTEEYMGLGKRIDELPEAKIVLNNKTDLDLAASFIDSSSLIFPAKDLGFDPGKDGWWKREAVDLVWWRNFLHEKYALDNQDFDLGGGWAIGEGNLKLKVQNKNLKLKKGDALLVRVMESSRSGSLSFYQDDKLLGKIQTKSKQDANIRWFEVGKLVQDGEELSITSFGDINVVNALAVLSSDKWSGYKNRADNLKDRIIKFDGSSLTNFVQPNISYRKINPTKYLVSITNLSQPSFLVFSQNYDGLWKIGNRSSLPVYSLLDGFRVEKDGQYIVEYAAQKYVYIGLIITGITVVVLISLFLMVRKQH